MEKTVLELMAECRRLEERAAQYVEAFSYNLDDPPAGAMLQIFSQTKGVVSLYITPGFEMGILLEYLQEVGEHHATRARQLVSGAFSDTGDRET